MIRYLIVSFATVSLMFSASGCTSKKVEAEPDATSEMTDDGMSAEGEAGGDAVAEGGEAAAPEGGSSDFSEDDFGSEDAAAGSEKTAGAEAAPAEGFDEASAEGSVAETTPATDGAADNLGAGTDSTDSTDAMGADAGAPADTAMNDSTSSLGGDEMGGLSEEPPAPKPVVPLKKIQTTPWTQAGILLNAVYVARPGDTFKSVSQKVYGSEEKVSELKKANPSIASRKMKVGDKVYYNSPKRPTDNMQMMTFYEDLGLSPEVYVSAPGDNVKDVAKKLLGDSNSWKELWSTNLDVESKGELAEGTRLRYWAGDLVAQAPAPEAAAPTDAMNTPPPADAAAPQMPDEAPAPPPATAEVAPPPPPSDEMSPPPPPAVAEAPPVPADSPTAESSDVASNPLAAILGDGGDQTTALMIGAILLIAAVALFIIIRKRKARRNIDFQTATHTHID